MTASRSKVGEAIAVYSSELNHIEGDAVDPEVLLADRIAKGAERLKAAREALAALREAVAPPGEELDYIRFFRGNTRGTAIDQCGVAGGGGDQAFSGDHGG